MKLNYEIDRNLQFKFEMGSLYKIISWKKLKKLNKRVLLENYLWLIINKLIMEISKFYPLPGEIIRIRDGAYSRGWNVLKNIVAW